MKAAERLVTLRRLNFLENSGRISEYYLKTCLDSVDMTVIHCVA